MTKQQQQAYQDWLNGMKRADIATKYGVTVNTVKSWITRHFKTAESAEKGAPKNKGVRKKGGQPGNTNTVKHGAYCQVLLDSLSEDEAAVMGDTLETPEEKLRKQQKILDIRELRLLKRVKDLQDASAGKTALILGSVTKSKIKRDGDKFGGDENMITAVEEGILTSIKIYERELTKVQAQIVKIAEKLIQLEKSADDKSKSDELIDEWVQGVMDSGGKH